jgi:hypothetical protein
VIELASGTKFLFWLGITATTISAGVLGYAVVKYVHIASILDMFLEK